MESKSFCYIGNPLFLLLILSLSMLSNANPNKYNGFNFLNGQWSGPKYDSNSASSMVDSIINQTSSNVIQLTFCWYQQTINTTSIYSTSSSPTDSQLTSIVKYAHSKGIKVIFRPCVDPQDMNDGFWRGQIGKYFDTQDWNLWFSNYTTFITHFANLANILAVDMFIVGLELIDTTTQTQHWIDVINSVRSEYKGPIRYDANHGNENNVKYWSEVDYIGIDAYYPLDSNNNNPSLTDLNDAWIPIVSDLQKLSEQHNKQIMFGEIGYCSSYGTNTDPAHCYQNNQLDLQAQNNCYESFFQSVYNQTWFEGVFFWSWVTDPNDMGVNNTGFTVNGKPSAAICKQYFELSSS